MHAPRPVRQLTALPLAALLLLAGLAAAQGPAKTASLFTAAEAAVTARRVESSKALGFRQSRGVFSELPAEGAVLVGFDVGVGKFGDIETVYALRAVYNTAQGEISGQDHGLFHGQRKVGKRTHKSKVLRRVRVVARPGYAVGGITLRSGLNINGLSLTYMRIDGRPSTRAESYTSEWVGDRTGGHEADVNGDGAPVVGIHGSQDVEHVSSLGLIYMTPPPVVAQAPPRIERPAEQPAPPPRVEVPVPPPVAPPAPKEERAQAPPPPEEKQAEQPAAPNPARDEDRPWPAAQPQPRRAVQGQPTAPTFAPSLRRFSAAFFALAILAVAGLVAGLGNYVRKRQFLDRSAGALDRSPTRKPTRPKAPAAPATPVPPEAPPAPVASTGICERPRHAPGCGGHAPPDRPMGDRPPAGQAADAKWGEPPCAKPNARVYYHVTCGKATIVSGDDYVLLECPFRPVSSTFCCGCQTFVPLHMVRWADSDEPISTYRQRVRATVPFWRQVYLALFGTASEGAVNWGKEWKGGDLPARR